MRCHEILQRTLQASGEEARWTHDYHGWNSKAPHLVSEQQIPSQNSEITCIEHEDGRHLLGRTGKYSIHQRMGRNAFCRQ